MVYYSSILFPNEEKLDSYDLVDTYPFPLFWRKRLFELPLSDITVLYGNNGSGKSTLLSLIGLLLKAERDVPLYDDTTYKLEGRAYHPFHDFAGMMEARRAVDAYGDKLDAPRTRAFLTSDGLFRKIAARREENRATRIRRDEFRKKRGELARSAYHFDSLDDLDDLWKRNEALRTTARSYGLRHGGNLEEERSNGESAVDIFLSILEKDGFYLIDEPENCLSLSSWRAAYPTMRKKKRGTRPSEARQLSKDSDQLINPRRNPFHGKGRNPLGERRSPVPSTSSSAVALRRGR